MGADYTLVSIQTFAIEDHSAPCFFFISPFWLLSHQLECELNRDMSPIHIKRLFNAIIVVAGAAAAATTAPFAFFMQCHARAFNRGGEHRRLKHV